MNRIRRIGRDQAGMTYVFVGMGLMAFISASMLAIDVGMLMTARNQAQNSADAGALAGAVALVFDDFDDRTAAGPAVTSAIAASTINQVMSGAVSVTPGDVQFLNDPSGRSNRVRVTVRRSADRGNPVSTLIARYFGVTEADINAVATAEASPANAMTCVKPFTIPDRWIEKQTPDWDPEDTFDMVDKWEKPIVPADIYRGPGDRETYTGYDAERDKGMQVVLKADQDSKLAPSIYQPWAVEGTKRGANEYRDAICECVTTEMGFGDTFVVEPGNMKGPTRSGIDCLIARDPGAYWDVAAKKVISTRSPSPRVVAIPLFDPVYYDTGKREGRNASLKFINYMGFFIEEMRGDEVVGRITPIGGLRRGAGFGPAPEGAFPKSIRLVE